MNRTFLQGRARRPSATSALRWSSVALKLVLAATLVGCVAGTTNASQDLVYTPLILSVHDAPVAFKGSDGHRRLVYELWITNFSSKEMTVTGAEVFGDGHLLQTLDTSQVAGRLQPAGERDSTGIMEPGTVSLLFLDVALPDGTPVPKKLSHQITFISRGGAAEYTETGGEIKVDTRAPLVTGPPLAGDNYISADSCCDATRHTRAALPLNGQVWLAQRYAVDWERLDSDDRIYSGPKDDVHSYTIYGDDVYAVANGKVVLAVDGLPDQTPGIYPVGIPPDEADGNSVILDLGGGNYALYAHLEPGSVLVHKGETVTRGEVIGKVGNSGNTIAPHLHFQMTDRDSSLAANGLPYLIDSYSITGISPGTEAFDEAEANGTPLDVTPVIPPAPATDALPLDQLIISFPSPGG